jgi:hypothetical protein
VEDNFGGLQWFGLKWSRVNAERIEWLADDDAVELLVLVVRDGW